MQVLHSMLINIRIRNNAPARPFSFLKRVLDVLGKDKPLRKCGGNLWKAREFFRQNLEARTMLMKTILAGAAVAALGFSSTAIAQTMEPEYQMGPPPVYDNGPAYEEPMTIDAPRVAPDGYDTGYAPRGYYAEPGYNDGYSSNWRGKIRDDLQNETNGVNTE
jgi:hypothetical protein